MAKRAVKVNGTRVRDPEHQTLIRSAAKHFAKDERAEMSRPGASRGRSRQDIDKFVRGR